MFAEPEDTRHSETGQTETNPHTAGPTAKASARRSHHRTSSSAEASASQVQAAGGSDEPRPGASVPSAEGTDTADGADQTERAESPEGAASVLDPAAQLREAQEEAERYRANWQRAAADLVNYRRRADQEKEDAIKYGSTHLLKALLPIFDDLERAIANAPEEIAGTSWFEGLQMLSRKIESTLQSQGVEAIEAAGQPFDPTLHEAVLYEEGEEGKVTAEFQKGYRLHGRVVRPSLVRVGSGQRRTED